MNGERQREALERLPLLLTAWVKVNRAFLKRPPSIIVISDAVVEEISTHQGYTIRYARFDGKSKYFPMGIFPPDTICLRPDKELIGRIARALRKAWRDAITKKREPSLDGLNSSRRLRSLLLELQERGLDRGRIISRIKKQIEATNARWIVAIRKLKEGSKPRKRPTISNSKFVLVYINENDNLSALTVVRYEGKQRKSDEVALTNQNLEIYKLLRRRLRNEEEEGRQDIDADDLRQIVYSKKIPPSDRGKVNQNLRQVVSRFNRKWRTALGRDFLEAIKREPGTWAILQVRITHPQDKE